MDNPFKSPAVISFCPGILGIERGLARAGVNCRVMAYVEIEAFIIANLVAGMESGILDPAPIWTDAKTFDASPFRGRIHGIIGGYPCTPFSLAGTRSGEDHLGYIYPAISRAIEAARPVWCFFENVDDHLTLGFDKVYKDLQRMGYAVEAGIYTAEEVGAPHERKRLFILAIASSFRYGWLNTGGLLAETFGTGEEMAYSNSTGQPKQRDNGQQKKANNNGISRSSSELADTFISNVQRGFKEGDKQRNESEGRSRVIGSSNNQWPVGQGCFQYEWEEPRTVESGVGCTIDGYNFREDILRALGNSVVEQTAEIAFIDLMRKHLA